MPIGLMFFIAILAETNRAPFDLPEAESELVAGFMTEHGASIFVFFFLGEYSSLILMSTFMSIFFLGGHHCPDLHKIIIDPFIFLFYFLESKISNFYNYYIYYFDTISLDSDLRILDNQEYLSDKYSYYYSSFESNIVKYLESCGPHELYLTKFTSKDTILEFVNLLINKIQGSYILGFKIIIVVFFFI
jgi:hypothetical protein